MDWFAQSALRLVLINKLKPQKRKRKRAQSYIGPVFSLRYLNSERSHSVTKNRRYKKRNKRFKKQAKKLKHMINSKVKEDYKQKIKRRKKTKMLNQI